MNLSIPTESAINEIIFPFNRRVQLSLFFDVVGGLNAVYAIRAGDSSDDIDQLFFANTRSLTGAQIVASLNAAAPVFESVLVGRSESGRWPMGAGVTLEAAFISNLPAEALKSLD